jgi:hypothetical protein
MTCVFFWEKAAQPSVLRSIPIGKMLQTCSSLLFGPRKSLRNQTRKAIVNQIEAQLPLNASQRLVQMILTIARGIKNFQPKPINWS